MRGTFATIYGCDACGAETTVAPPSLPTDGTAPVPEGWLGHGDRLPWYLGDPFGSRFQDICPSCMRLSFGQLVEKIKQRAEMIARGERQPG